MFQIFLIFLGLGVYGTPESCPSGTKLGPLERTFIAIKPDGVQVRIFKVKKVVTINSCFKFEIIVLEKMFS